MEERKLEKILSITPKILFGISTLAFATFVADSSYFNKLNLDVWTVGMPSLYGAVVFGITSLAISRANSIRRNRNNENNRFRRLTSEEDLDRIYQETLKYFRRNLNYKE